MPPLPEEKVEEPEPTPEKLSDSPKKPLLMVANKPKGLPKSGPKPGGLGGPKISTTLINKSLEKPSCVKK